MSSDAPRRQVLVERSGVSVSLCPSRGGEILVALRGEVSANGEQATLRVAEALGSPPTPLSFDEYADQTGTDEAIFGAFWGSLRIEKRLRAAVDSGRIEIDYVFLNAGPVFIRPAFGLRIQAPPGSDVEWRLPVAAGVRSGRLADGVATRYLRLDAPWCGVTLGEQGITLLFPEQVLDAAEIRSETPTASGAVTALVYTIGLNPGCEATMTVCLCAGAMDVASIAEQLRDTRDRRRTRYGPVTPGRRASVEQRLSAGSADLPENLEARRICQRLQERAQDLANDRERRLELLARLGDEELSIGEAIQRLRE